MVCIIWLPYRNFPNCWPTMCKQCDTKGLHFCCWPKSTFSLQIGPCYITTDLIKFITFYKGLCKLFFICWQRWIARSLDFFFHLNAFIEISRSTLVHVLNLQISIYLVPIKYILFWIYFATSSKWEKLEQNWFTIWNHYTMLVSTMWIKR